MAKLGPGARIGDQFTLIRKIGEGGCGEVYLAEQNFLERKAVVKLMHVELSRDPSYVMRFRREAKLADSLRHHHTAAIYAFGETPDRALWIAMEYIEGESLHTVLAREPPRQVAELLTPVADVLDRAGDLGIIHRDVKPDNIIVAPDGGGRRAVLLDFGLARPMEDTDKLTAVGVAVGSPTYMSPEQVFGPTVDSATDRYALGIILYIAVAKRPPFRHDDRVQLVLMHKRASVPELCSLVPTIPKGHPLDQFFTKALAKQPGDRYPSARQMVNEFSQILAESPLGEPGARPPTPRVTQAVVVPPQRATQAAVPAIAVPVGQRATQAAPVIPAVAPVRRTVTQQMQPPKSPPPVQKAPEAQRPAVQRPAARLRTDQRAPQGRAEPAPEPAAAPTPEPAAPVTPVQVQVQVASATSAPTAPVVNAPPASAGSESQPPGREPSGRNQHDNQVPAQASTVLPGVVAGVVGSESPVKADDNRGASRFAIDAGWGEPKGSRPGSGVRGVGRANLDRILRTTMPNVGGSGPRSSPGQAAEEGAGSRPAPVSVSDEGTDPTLQIPKEEPRPKAAPARPEAPPEQAVMPELAPALPGHRRLLVRGARVLDVLCAAEVTLGKHRDCDLVCRAYPSPEQDAITHGVSRQHARLKMAAGKVTIEDLSSLNGTYLDDKRLSGGPTALYDEARIRLGPVLMLEVRLFRSGALLLRRVDSYHGDHPATLLIWERVALGEQALGLVPPTGDSVTRWGMVQQRQGELWWTGPEAIRWQRKGGEPSRPQTLQPGDRLGLGGVVVEWDAGTKPGLG